MESRSQFSAFSIVTLSALGKQMHAGRNPVDFSGMLRLGQDSLLFFAFIDLNVCFFVEAVPASDVQGMGSGD